MKKEVLLLLLTGIVLHLNIVAQKGFLQLTDIWSGHQLVALKAEGFRSMNDGNHYSNLVKTAAGKMIFMYDFKSGNITDTLLTDRQLISGKDTIEIEDYQFSTDESKILITSHIESIYRHSTKADYYIFNRNTHRISRVAPGGKIMYCCFSPTDDKLAYVRDNNLFYFDLANEKEIQVTSDGKKNEIINGATDWVYEEEFTMDVAYQWSPDGKKIAYFKFDESRVKEVELEYYGELYPRLEKYKYPKAGEENSKVSLQVFDLNSAQNKTMDVGNSYEYLPRLQWTGDPNVVSVQRLNRHQNELDLLFCNASTGTSSLIVSQKNENYVEVNDDLCFLADGKHFIWTNSDDGFNHIYMYNLDGSIAKQITKGSFDVTKYYGFDETSGTFYYQSDEVNPVEREVFSISMEGVKSNLTPEKGTHQALFSKTFNYFVDTYSAFGMPFRCTVNDRKGNSVRLLEDNKKVKDELRKYRLGPTSFFNFKAPDGTLLYGWMIKPPDFDSTKYYPVLFYVYGGPHSQNVLDYWGVNTTGTGANNYLWHQFMAQRGYVVVCVDNRGTPGRGAKFANCIYKNMGAAEVQDQLAAVTYMKHFSWVDFNRIGIWGWSFGGYLTSLLLTKTGAYKAGIAVAPVTNWRNYDAIYTERFLQTPQENPHGYDDNSPISFAKNLNGKFLLVHGGADDNVHVQNSMEFINALVKTNKKFDFMIYPNRAHGINSDGSRLHLYTKMTDFILYNL